MYILNSKNILCLIYVVLVSSFFSESIAEGCDPGKKQLFFHCDSTVNSIIDSTFSEDFIKQLKSPLLEIGYCLTTLDSAAPTDSSNLNDLLMNLSFNYSEEDSIAVVLIGLQRISEWEENPGPSNPLLSLVYEPGEISTFLSVLVRKTVENLRTGYVCHLRIQSVPVGVRIKAETGLEGSTPLEWILPVGDMMITGELDGFESVQRKLDLSDPGIHTYLLEMQKRLFYHSKFIYPAAVFGLSAIACFAAERYYYSRYMELGREDYFNNPERFAVTYNRAKVFEGAAFTSLILSCTSLALTFWF